MKTGKLHTKQIKDVDKGRIQIKKRLPLGNNCHKFI